MLDIQNIDFSYGKHTLFRGFSTSFSSGINVLIGSNGSGKTTLMKLLAGIYSPKGGFISLNDKRYSAYKDIRRYLSYLPQEFHAYQEMKVKDFLNFIAEIKCQNKSKYLQDQISEAIDMTDISSFLEKKIKALSGGMKKRVGIAQAIVADSKVIIADEPTAALDPEQCESFNNILKKLSKDKIIITSTHIIQDIYAQCDKIYIISEGSLKYVGSFQDLQDTLSDNIFKIEKGPLFRAIQDKVRVISEFEENGKEFLKFTGRDGYIDRNWIPCGYTSADIWRYYK